MNRLDETWEVDMYRKMPIDQRLKNLRECLERLDAWRKGHSQLVMLTNDVIRAARGVVVEEQDNGTERQDQNPGG